MYKVPGAEAGLDEHRAGVAGIPGRMQERWPGHQRLSKPYRGSDATLLHLYPKIKGHQDAGRGMTMWFSLSNTMALCR